MKQLKLSYFSVPFFIVIVTAKNNFALTFSGFYVPNSTYNQEYYGASWLMSLERFLLSVDSIKNITTLEGATIAMMTASCQNCSYLVTRDFFDFMNEHLSSSANSLANKVFFPFLKNRLEVKIERFKSEHSKKKYLPNSASNKTVVLVPFSALSAKYNRHKRNSNSFTTVHQHQLRLLFIQCTFWAMYKHFPYIMIGVFSKQDVIILESLRLPVWSIINLSKHYSFKETRLVPKHTLLVAHDMLIFNKIWRRIGFKYVLFNEGDQILHIRRLSQLLNRIDSSQGAVALIPHRMQTIQLPKDLPLDLQSSTNPILRESLSEVRLITQDSIAATGSCCDHGRFVFRECGTQWWWNCAQWGLVNYSNWIKFGKFGFTMPLGTEHQARCTFSEMEITCPSTTNCTPSDGRNCVESPVIEIVPK